MKNFSLFLLACLAVAHVAAGKIVDTLGLDLPAQQQHHLETGVHYFLGVAPEPFMGYIGTV